MLSRWVAACLALLFPVAAYAADGPHPTSRGGTPSGPAHGFRTTTGALDRAARSSSEGHLNDALHAWPAVGKFLHGPRISRASGRAGRNGFPRLTQLGTGTLRQFGEHVAAAAKTAPEEDGELLRYVAAGFYAAAAHTAPTQAAREDYHQWAHHLSNGRLGHSAHELSAIDYLRGVHGEHASELLQGVERLRQRAPRDAGVQGLLTQCSRTLVRLTVFELRNHAAAGARELVELSQYAHQVNAFGTKNALVAMAADLLDRAAHRASDLGQPFEQRWRTMASALRTGRPVQWDDHSEPTWERLPRSPAAGQRPTPIASP